jgi:hypothetical protein
MSWQLAVGSNLKAPGTSVPVCCRTAELPHCRALLRVIEFVESVESVESENTRQLAACSWQERTNLDPPLASCTLSALHCRTGELPNCRTAERICLGCRTAERSSSERSSFNRHALGEIPGLVHVAAALHCDVVSQQLQGNRLQDWRHILR